MVFQPIEWISSTILKREMQVVIHLCKARIMRDPDPAGSKALGSGLIPDPAGSNISGSGVDPDPAGSKNSGSGAPLVTT